MTTWLLAKINYPSPDLTWRETPRLLVKELILLTPFLCLIGIIYIVDKTLFGLIVETMSDAYIAVSVFVSITLAGFYYLDRHLKADLRELLNRKSILQVPVAAFLGALPGCGGAIIVVTQFVNGSMSFGALVAVLIATMGDAAFLLIAKEAETAALVYGLSLCAGIVSGYIINAVHGHDYLKRKSDETQLNTFSFSRTTPLKVYAFIGVLVPGVIFGLLEAFLVDTNALFGAWTDYQPVTWLGFIGALLCISVWVGQPLDSWSARFAEKTDIKHLKETVVAETSFISVWVILGFLSYEFLVYSYGLDLQSVFQQLGGLAILFAVLIGFIPGCGPQIVTTTLYLNGVIPLSAQLANAISNDGDALFPALALAPKAAFNATLYSAIPALLLGYCAYSLGW
ncbi:MAG: putative manganese transporter [Oleiphilaceae bacterium]|nr:putative manganese transporter [Oleiphilaceae bacterium]